MPERCPAAPEPIPTPDVPQHDLTPERLIETQRCEVEEVRDRADPRERAAAPRGDDRNLGVSLRHIHLGPGVIVHREFVHRPLAKRERPLIGTSQPRHVVQPILGNSYERRGNRLRLRRIDLASRSPVSAKTVVDSRPAAKRYAGRSSTVRRVTRSGPRRDRHAEVRPLPRGAPPTHQQVRAARGAGRR